MGLNTVYKSLWKSALMNHDLVPEHIKSQKLKIGQAGDGHITTKMINALNKK